MKKLLVLLALVCVATLYAVPEPVDEVFDFKKIDRLVSGTKDLKLRCLYVDTVGGERLPLPAYNLRVETAEPGQQFYLISRRIDGVVTIERNCTVDKNHLLRSADESDTPLMLVLGGFAPGEAIDYYLLSNDARFCAHHHLIPRPIGASIDCGYHLSVEIDPDTNQMFFIYGDGFEPNEVVEMASIDESKRVSQQCVANQEGRVKITFVPGKVDEEGGLSHFELTGNRGVIKVSFPWGNEFELLRQHVAETEPDLNVVIERLTGLESEGSE